MEKLFKKQSHTNHEIDANMKNDATEEQDDSIINKFDNHPVNNISNDGQVCIYNLSIRQSFVKFDFIIKIKIHM
jgi:hypothetical protein